MRTEDTAPRRLIRRVRDHGGLARTLAMVTLAAVSLPAFGQSHSRIPLNAGPAGVELVATLESLSVSAASDTIEDQVAFPAAAAAISPISITSSWAVPANLTTIRMAGCFTDEDPPATGSTWEGMPFAPLTEGLSGTSSAEQQCSVLRQGVLGLAIFSQRAGETNQAFMRTDELDAGTPAHGEQIPSPSPDTATLSIVLQAL
jgi:hypothetical protein